MGILDRTRAALRPANSIEQATAPERPAPGPAADPRVPAPATSERRTSAERKSGAHTTEPEAITRSYFVEDRGGERRYYDDYRRQSLAMRATTTAIRSKREDLSTIRAMLTLAQARGWQALEVKGTTAFRREAWIEAQARGLEARGHRASDPDRQEALRRRAEQGLGNRIEAPVPTSRPFKPTREMPAPINSRATEPVKAERGQAKLSSDPEGLRRAHDTLSPEARLVLGAMKEKIERQMRRQDAGLKAELKAFVTTELWKKERAGGPVELSAAQRRAATAPAPMREVAKPTPDPAPARRLEPEAPRRTMSR